MKPILFLVALVSCALIAGCTTINQANADVTPYPFKTCAVLNKPLDSHPRRRVYDGQEVLFCCAPCVKAFEANPEPYMARIRTAMANGGDLTHPEGSQQAVVEAAVQMGKENQ